MIAEFRSYAVGTTRAGARDTLGNVELVFAYDSNEPTVRGRVSSTTRIRRDLKDITDALDEQGIQTVVSETYIHPQPHDKPGTLSQIKFGIAVFADPQGISPEQLSNGLTAMMARKYPPKQAQQG